MKKGLLILIFIVVAIGAWSLTKSKPRKLEEKISNPASIFCTNRGGNTVVRTDANGSQAGYCIFDDRSECEEWAYYRGVCKMGGQKSFR